MKAEISAQLAASKHEEVCFPDIAQGYDLDSYVLGGLLLGPVPGSGPLHPCSLPRHLALVPWTLSRMLGGVAMWLLRPEPLLELCHTTSQLRCEAVQQCSTSSHLICVKLPRGVPRTLVN